MDDFAIKGGPRRAKKSADDDEDRLTRGWSRSRVGAGLRQVQGWSRKRAVQEHGRSRKRAGAG